jgi:hypothetical protein
MGRLGTGGGGVTVVDVRRESAARLERAVTVRSSSPSASPRAYPSSNSSSEDSGEPNCLRGEPLLAAGPPNSSSQLSGRPALRFVCFEGDFACGGGGKALLGLCCDRAGESSKSSSQFSVDFVEACVRRVGVCGVVDDVGASCSAQCVRFFLSPRILGGFMSSSSSSCGASQSELAMDMRFGIYSFTCFMSFGCFVCEGWNSKSSSQFSEGTVYMVSVEYSIVDAWRMLPVT